jgi:hypothetical protein
MAGFSNMADIPMARNLRIIYFPSRACGIDFVLWLCKLAEVMWRRLISDELGVSGLWSFLEQCEIFVRIGA